MDHKRHVGMPDLTTWGNAYVTGIFIYYSGYVSLGLYVCFAITLPSHGLLRLIAPEP